jgi:tetratricopeptide (TPR) repeat protein
MDTLKKWLLGLLIIIANTVSAQQTTAWQDAFYKSYEAETAGKFTVAINDLLKIYKSDDYFINLRLGWLFYQAKQHQRSEQYYRRAIRLKPYSIEARFGAVKPLSATGQWDQVKLQYTEILKIDPQNTMANYWLGVIHYNRKEFMVASKLFEKVVNLYPLDYDSVIMLAWTKLNLGKTAEARLLFQHALTLRKNDESALNGLKLIK